MKSSKISCDVLVLPDVSGSVLLLAARRHDQFVPAPVVVFHLSHTFRLCTLTGRYIQVVFKSIAFLLFGQQVVKNELDQAGLWTLSYLDDDMRVLTARSLERDTGNVYVLARA